MSDNNIQFIIKNLLDDAVATTDAVTYAGLGVDNLINEDKSFILKTTTASDFTITHTLAAPALIDAVCFAKYNFHGTSTLRVKIWETLDTNLDPVYDSGIKDIILKKVWGIDFIWGVDNIHTAESDIQDDIFLLNFDTVYFRVMKVYVYDADNVDGSTEIGRMFAGQSFSPKYNLNYGFTFTDVNDCIQTRTQDGLWANAGNVYRKFDLTLQWLLETEYLILRNKLKKQGRHKDILVVIYPDAYEAKKNQHAIIGKFTENSTFNHDYFDNYKTSYSIEEN